MLWKIWNETDCEVNKKVGELSKVIKKLLCQKGLKTKEEIEFFLNPDYETGINDPFLFKDMKKLVFRIGEVLKNNEKVGIFGDHDVDGITSSTILADGLEELGIETYVYIPDKHTEGHGINEKAIEEFKASGVTLMITVDCGTNDVEKVEYAKKKDIDVIITDHHLPLDVLPDAIAIINPNIKGCTYPFKGLCGAGVAFKVLQALYREFIPQKSESLKWMLDIVAIGTVSDCMPLIDENRVFVKYGLLVLSKTKRIGLQKMIDIGNINISTEKSPTSSIIGFQIGPRINAAGRMAHARDAFDLLREDDYQKAEILAIDLENKNNKRRELTDKLIREIEKKVKENFEDKQFIFISGENYPIGIVGIIAGRIANKFGKPTGIFQKNDDLSKGSFRSAGEINIVEVLEESSMYLEKYGGHKAAAGAVIKNKNISNFINLASNIVAKKTNNKKLESKIIADLKINLNDISIELADKIEKFEPFGEGNKEPIFWIDNLIILEARAIGNNKKHLKLTVKEVNSAKSIDVIGFGFGNDLKEIKNQSIIKIMANIQKNEWNGNCTAQLNMISWKSM